MRPIAFENAGGTQGFGVTWMRTVGLMTSYFIFLDSGRRNFNEYFQRPLLGPFLISGLAATAAWWIVWPLEYMKSQQTDADLSEVHVHLDYLKDKKPTLSRLGDASLPLAGEDDIDREFKTAQDYSDKASYAINLRN
ncbi:hypothetical protein HPB51_017123 [Rhipicephalus microplus]|uniref:Uncharacterized protein n=1 Tax=Rhipicephalus microplus TaxID=6941 RepID=A0A9J6EPF5_RHIMP|nr:hypothetical protein HPB51_017123 [Rhipicephalus microplus]